MSGQLELLGVPKLMFPPPRPQEWEDLASGNPPVWVHVSRRWRDVVVETLTTPTLGKRHILWRTRRGYGISSYPAHRDAQAHRTIMLSPHGAEDLHRNLPLIEIIDRGDGWAKFRPAGAADAPLQALTIPPIKE